MTIYNVVIITDNTEVIGRITDVESYVDYDVAHDRFRKLRETHLSLLIHDPTYQDWKVREDEDFGFLMQNDRGQYIDIGMFNTNLEVSNETYGNS